MPSPALFANVPNRDTLGFGLGAEFKPEAVSDWLDLKKVDVSRLAAVSVESVRWDKSIPGPVRDRLEQVAITCNLVAEAFDGDVTKAMQWFKTKNPMLGDVSPRDMVRLGRFDRLRKFVLSALSERTYALNHRGAEH